MDAQRETIDLLREETLPAVCAIDADSFSCPWSERDFRELLALPYNHFYVLRRGERVAGYVGVSCICGSADILNIAVHPDFRRQGAGRALMEHAHAEAAAMGAQELLLEVRRSNTAAQALYRSLGYTEIAQRKNYYRHPTEDALIWRLCPLQSI